MLHRISQVSYKGFARHQFLHFINKGLRIVKILLVYLFHNWLLITYHKNFEINFQWKKMQGHIFFLDFVVTITQAPQVSLISLY